MQKRKRPPNRTGPGRQQFTATQVSRASDWGTAQLVRLVNQVNQRAPGTIVPASTVTERALWADLDEGAVGDGEGGKTVQELLMRLGVDERAWSQASSAGRRSAIEFARAVIRMGPTLMVSLEPARLLPTARVESVGKKAHKKLRLATKELLEKSSGTQSVRELVKKYAVQIAAYAMRDALIVLLEPLQDSIKANPRLKDKQLAEELSNHLHGVDEIEVGLRHLGSQERLVTKADLDLLSTNSARLVAIRLTHRAFADAVSPDDLRRSGPKR